MQGLADGYFIAPYTIGDYLANDGSKAGGSEDDSVRHVEQEVHDGVEKLLAVKGKRTVLEFHRELGKAMWEYVGMSRNQGGLQKAIGLIGGLREQFWHDVYVPGSGETLNKNLEFAGRVADYLELGELIAVDALERRESCGGHFREEFQTTDGEALRDDDNFTHVAVWEFRLGRAVRHIEPLQFENVKLT